MKLTFLGATGTVTGSKYLLQHNDRKTLIDCGLIQGLKELRLLVKNGIKGPVYCSKVTFELCRILLPDSGYLQEDDAKRANRRSYSRHEPAKPLYDRLAPVARDY